MTPAEARTLAEAHIAHLINTTLQQGWPKPDDFGYTEQEADLIRHELETLANAMATPAPPNHWPICICPTCTRCGCSHPWRHHDTPADETIVRVGAR